MLARTYMPIPGDAMVAQMPSKKLWTKGDHEYMDSVKVEFEAYLRSILAMSQLRSSELLHTFLTVDDFSKSSASELGIGEILVLTPFTYLPLCSHCERCSKRATRVCFCPGREGEGGLRGRQCGSVSFISACLPHL